MAKKTDTNMIITIHIINLKTAGYYTAPFRECNILVIDAIGEWETITIWDNMKKIRS